MKEVGQRVIGPSSFHLGDLRLIKRSKMTRQPYCYDVVVSRKPGYVACDRYRIKRVLRSGELRGKLDDWPPSCRELDYFSMLYKTTYSVSKSHLHLTLPRGRKSRKTEVGVPYDSPKSPRGVTAVIKVSFESSSLELSRGISGFFGSCRVGEIFPAQVQIRQKMACGGVAPRTSLHH